VLSLENTKITDAGLERLKGLSSLRHLFLGATQVTDAGVNELTKALPNVTVRREVVDPRMAGEDTKRTPVREAGRDVAITVIEQLRGRYQCDEQSPDRPIVAVWLAGPQVTDDALKYLSRLTCLGSLTLEGAPVTDAGLEHLKGLTNLQELFLRCPRVTDAGLQHLKGLTSLRTLRLHDTQVTFAGVIELRRALPESTWLEVEPKPAPPPRPGRDAVIAGIEKLGGKYQCDEEHPDKPIVKVWLNGPQVTDAALRIVAALPSLKFLFLGGTQVTDLEIHRFQSAFPNVVLRVESEQPKRTEPEVGRDAAIAAIEKLGGSYGCDEQSPDKPIVGVRLLGRQVTNAELYYLEGLTSLRYLDLSGTDVTDAGLLHLMGLTNLQRLVLNETQINGTGFEHLKGLTSLHEVALNDSRVTDAGVQHLKGLSNLRKLELGKTWITDASLEHLKEMASLETLNLSFTEVTDAGVTELRKTHKALQSVTASGGVDQPTVFAEVEPQAPPHSESVFGEPKPTAPETGRDAAVAVIKKLGGTFQTKVAGGPITRVFFSVRRVIDADLEHLKGLTSLQELMLHGSRVTGPGLEHLKGLTSLQALSLEGSNITDAGLVHLKELTSLKSLSLKGSKITDAGLVHLKGLTRLQVLNLLDTQVTDAGLEHLKGLTSLLTLNVDLIRLTPAAVAELHKALPNCYVGL
jgi:Leucine-rich repeat (LRR) protein